MFSVPIVYLSPQPSEQVAFHLGSPRRRLPPSFAGFGRIIPGHRWSENIYQDHLPATVALPDAGPLVENEYRFRKQTLNSHFNSTGFSQRTCRLIRTTRCFPSASCVPPIIIIHTVRALHLAFRPLPVLLCVVRKHNHLSPRWVLSALRPSCLGQTLRVH